jgi:hypothetical protein
MLYTRLKSKRTLRSTNEMLQMLLHLSGDGASSSHVARTPSILNSVFASKVLNKVDYTSSVALR